MGFRAKVTRFAKDRGMNGLETRYNSALAERKMVGEIHSFRYEAIKFRMADKTFYTPDFLVITSSGEVEIHETKGFWEEDARIKIKTVAEMFPEFRFIAVQWDKREGWKYEYFD